MTVTGERDIACRMWVEPDSLPYLRQFALPLSAQITQALTPLLHHLPAPRLRVRWHPARRLWISTLIEDHGPEPPDIATLMEWMDEGVCEATDGCIVEPDGVCPHGKKSWLLVLGLI
jgi:hypothetical protein